MRVSAADGPQPAAHHRGAALSLVPCLDVRRKARANYTQARPSESKCRSQAKPSPTTKSRFHALCVLTPSGPMCPLPPCTYACAADGPQPAAHHRGATLAAVPPPAPRLGGRAHEAGAGHGAHAGCGFRGFRVLFPLDLGGGGSRAERLGVLGKVDPRSGHMEVALATARMPGGAPRGLKGRHMHAGLHARPAVVVPRAHCWC